MLKGMLRSKYPVMAHPYLSKAKEIYSPAASSNGPAARMFFGVVAHKLAYCGSSITCRPSVKGGNNRAARMAIIRAGGGAKLGPAVQWPACFSRKY